MANYFNKEYLHGLHTRQLHAHLVGLRRLESKWGEYYQLESTFKNLRKEIDFVKAILATREHIPNKQEARKIRQEKARIGRDR